jgi:DNA-binding transcriptional LysR family regulator
MEWSDIRVFLQVVREGTMAGSTNSLQMDHSTISRRIARLERVAGVPLFERAGRRLAITKEGARLADAAEKLESIIIREFNSLSESHSEISGRVRIGTTEEFGVHYLATRLPAIINAHADLEIELVPMSRSFSLATREVDICVTMDRPTTGDIRCKKLTSFCFGLFGSSSLLDEKPRPTSWSQLQGNLRCSYIPEMLHTLSLDFKFDNDYQSGARYRSTSIGVQLAAVAGGHAVAILPCFVGSSDKRLERLLPDEISFERDYWLTVHDDLASSPKVRAVMTTIAEHVASDRALFCGSEGQASTC